MASSMPFGLSYNEAANPRAAPLQAWITAAATIGTGQYRRKPCIVTRVRKNHQQERRTAANSVPLVLYFLLYM